MCLANCYNLFKLISTLDSYRHSGLSRAQFHHLLKPQLELKSYSAGDPIPTKDYFYVIRDGVVAGDVAHLASGLQRSIRMYSGEMYVWILSVETLYFSASLGVLHRTKILLPENLYHTPFLSLFVVL